LTNRVENLSLLTKKSVIHLSIGTKLQKIIHPVHSQNKDVDKNKTAKT